MHLPEDGHMSRRNMQQLRGVYNILPYTYVQFLGFISHLIKYQISHSTEYQISHSTEYQISHSTEYQITHSTEYQISHSTEYQISHSTEYQITHCSDSLPPPAHPVSPAVHTKIKRNALYRLKKEYSSTPTTLWVFMACVNVNFTSGPGGHTE